ncbi:DUF721 domain-containing protein [Ectothiorhodospiraceae bacterium 2226]|nr:DUF721 domain-containing protein [Ectothiorhodospiraceae bacterium 2226]
MGRSPKPVGRWLGQLEPRARALLLESRRLAAIQAAIAGPLGPAAAHCRVGCVRDGTLILYTDSPAWAARLRYCAPAVLARLHTGGEPTVAQVRVKVRPAATETPTQRATLSERAAQILLDASNGLPPALGDALRRLARRAPRSR